MAKIKSLEAINILTKGLSVAQLSALHHFHGDPKFRDLITVINAIILTDKDKIVGLSSDTNTVDEAIRQASKQNFYRGRIASLVLLHSLFIGAESELEKREHKEK